MNWMPLSTISLGLCLALIACEPPTVEEEPDEPDEEEELVEEEEEEVAEEEAEEEGPVLVEPSQQSAQLLEAIEEYRQWETYAGADTHMESGHPGEVWVMAHTNELGVQAVEDETVPVPQGVIIVKEEYDADGAEEPMAVTVMEKLSDEMGDWYWLKADPSLESVVEMEGMALEGTEELGCINCHAANAEQDYLMLPEF